MIGFIMDILEFKVVGLIKLFFMWSKIFRISAFDRRWIIGVYVLMLHLCLLSDKGFF